MDIDDIIGSIEGKSAKPKASAGALDIDEILKGFEPTKKVAAPEAPINTERYPTQNGEPRPPFSGGNTPKSLPVEDAPALTSPSAYEQHKAGKEMVNSGLEDIQTGHPYKGVGKTALGVVQILGAPASGIIDDTIGKAGNKISPGFGDKAALVAGAAVPIVPGAGAVVKAIPKNKAFSTLVDSIGRENLPMVVRELKNNSRLAPADLSPKVLQDTQHLFANDGPQINYLANTSAERMATRKSSIEAAYDASAGVSPDLSQKITDLANASKKVGTEQINPLVKAAKPVNVTQTVENIDNILKPGVMSKITEGSTLALPEVKQALSAAKTWLANGKELRTGAEDLHDIQKALRRQGYALTKSANSGEREIGHALLKVRNDLVADIDKASPGYSKALDSYRDEMHIADAFKEGHDKILTSSKKIENDPSFVKKWFDGLNDYEKQAAKEGVRTAIHTEMGVAKNPALAGESVLRSDFNKAKMETILGKEEASKLFKALEDERAIANTHNKIVEGSQTAMRTASKQQFSLPTATEVMKSAPAVAASEASNYFLGGFPGVGTAILGTAKVGAMAKDVIAMKLAREHNAQYAKYALPTEGPNRDQLIRNLEAAIPKPKMTMLNKVRASLPTP